MPKSTENTGANDLASRLRQAAQQTDGGAPRATVAAPPSPPAATPTWSTSAPPAYTPSSPSGPGAGGGGGGRMTAIVAGAVAAVVVLGVIGFALVSAAGKNSEKKVTEVPASLDGTGVFSGISGYTLSAAPQSDVDTVRNGIVSRTDPANLDRVEGRMVAKGGKNVAESFEIVFHPAAHVNPQIGVDAVAAQLATSQKVTIAGATGIYGKTPGGSELIVVYKGDTGIVVSGSSRATLEDITTKLVANV